MPSTWTAPPPSLAGRRREYGGFGRAVLVGLVSLAVAVGVMLRLWYALHVPISADEAVVGLTAGRILGGHFSAFFPGQVYGGVEPYVVAAFVAVFGPGAPALEATAVVLAATASLLTWRVARRLVGDHRLAVLAGVLVWVAPLSTLWNSTVERGFRGVTLVCGLAALLCAVRLFDGCGGWLDGPAFGLAVGIGWWSSPEIVYLLLPSGLVVGAAVAGRCGAAGLTAPGRRFLAALAGALVGGLPWLWANVSSGFASLRPGEFAGSRSPFETGYPGRLDIFFAHVLPMQLGLLQPVSGAPVLRPPLETVATWAGAGLVVLVVLRCGRRGWPGLALAVAVVAFPFLYAVQPGTWFWEDGRYAVYLVPLLALALAVGVDGPGRPSPPVARATVVGIPRRCLAAGLLAAALLAAMGLTLVSFQEARASVDPANRGWFSGWGDPERPTEEAIATLVRQHVTAGFADYWVAYDLDFLSGGRLAVTDLPPDPDRSGPVEERVDRAADPAWLFVPARAEPVGWWQFGETTAIAGPAGWGAASFESALRRRGIGYRVVDAGLLEAVVPEHRVVAPP